MAAQLAHRVLVLDGATATVLGGAPADALVLSAPDAVAALHRAYLAAGADLIKTNSFNATSIGLAAYGLADRAGEINRRAATLARAAADAAQRAEPGRPRFVAGVLGAVHGTGVRRDELIAAYRAAAGALVAGGADLLLIETVFDSRIAQATLAAVGDMDGIPIMVSATVDSAGTLASGESAADFWAAVRAARPLAVGLNCSFGAAALADPLRRLADVVGAAVSAHPNAGLPDAAGRHPDGAAEFAAMVGGFAAQGLANIVGGCCGTTPAHIAALAAAVRNTAPRDF